MVAAFGLHDGCQLPRFPADLIVESVPRLDVFWLNRNGALAQDAVTEVEWGDIGGPRPARGVSLCRVVRKAPHLVIDGTHIVIAWDEPMPGVGRPYFLCSCGRRARFLYLRDTIRCAKCLGLDYASRHPRQRTPALGRVERLRRRLGDCELKPFAPLPAALRRGRSRAFHERLVTAILDEESKLLGDLQTVTRDLERRIRVRKERGKW